MPVLQHTVRLAALQHCTAETHREALCRSPLPYRACYTIVTACDRTHTLNWTSSGRSKRASSSPNCSEEEKALVRGLFLLTMKPVTYAANVNEADLADQGSGNLHVAALRTKAEQEGRQVVIVSAQVGCPPAQ